MGWMDSSPPQHSPEPRSKAPGVDEIAELRREIDELKRRTRKTARG
jgi:hypothetical protein